jgi:hypothetical protein
VPEPLCALEITGKGPVMTVKVNGHMLPCTWARLDLNAEQLPELTVSLPVVDDVVVTLDGVSGKFADETRAALVSMGWTPPAGDL